MKTVLIIAAALALTASAIAQSSTTNAPGNVSTPPGAFFPTNSPDLRIGFIGTLINWGTEYNTAPEVNWTNASLTIDTGIATVTGVGIADEINVEKPFGQFEAGFEAEFTGVGSAFNKVEASAGYAIFQKYDFKIVFKVAGGYDLNQTDKHGKRGALVVEPGLQGYKMMTKNTYATAEYSQPIESKGAFNALGKLYAGLGATF